MPTLTEEDIKLRLITPAIENAGWKKEQIFMEYFFTDGYFADIVHKARDGKLANHRFVQVHGVADLLAVGAYAVGVVFFQHAFFIQRF